MMISVFSSLNQKCISMCGVCKGAMGWKIDLGKWETGLLRTFETILAACFLLLLMQLQ